MVQLPLHDLISNRGFDLFWDDLESRFRALGFQYELTYCKPTNNPAMKIDLDSDTHMSGIIIWESGFCDLEVLQIADGRHVWIEHIEFASEEEFQTIFPTLIARIIDALRG